jgi:hypothetical protein
MYFHKKIFYALKTVKYGTSFLTIVENSYLGNMCVLPLLRSEKFADTSAVL